MKVSMSLWIAVSGMEEASVLAKFIKEHFNKPYSDIIIAGEHPFPTDDDWVEEKEDPK